MNQTFVLITIFLIIVVGLLAVKAYPLRLENGN